MNITSIAGVNSMKKRSSQGRKKIEIKKIEEENNRQVTFSKRRNGLFKKAAELCILTGAHITMLVHSPGGRVFAFGHPTVDDVADRFLNITTNNASTSDESTTQKGQLEKEFNQHYVEISKELEAEKKLRDVIQESKIINASELPWYSEDVDGLEVEELQQYISSLVELKRKVLVRADELMMIKKAPALLGPNMLSIAQANDIANMENPTNGTASSSFGFAHSHNREWMM
ncbi:unnamed protein product [Lactuca saligna]|uniref:MADS-box domain-containing protein n=1 Tax=Lactuca saligna TaxID=75948 RepID=A0AA36DUW6_LACSI|nr:unnamed protein product [Lactuca saligna]